MSDIRSTRRCTPTTRSRPSEVERRGIDLLKQVRVSDAERRINDFPHQFSGGMRQRAMIAMGLSNKPDLLIADEPTTALDVTVQAQILELLRDLNEQTGAAIILITHNLGVVAGLCKRVLVMYAGEIVEEGTVEQIFESPQHPYTWSLLRSVPRIDANRGHRLLSIEGLPPDLIDLPQGCKFNPRCPFRVERCFIGIATHRAGRAGAARGVLGDHGARLRGDGRRHHHGHEPGRGEWRTSRRAFAPTCRGARGHRGAGR